MKRHRDRPAKPPPVRQQQDDATAEQVAAALLARSRAPKPSPSKV